MEKNSEAQASAVVKKRRRAPGLRKSKVRDLPPTKPENAANFAYYGQWLALTLDDKKAMYPGTREVRDKETGEAILVQRVKDGSDIEFAAITGLTCKTLSEWKHKKELWVIRDEHMNLDMLKNLPAVMRGLTRNAIAHGRAHDVKTFMAIVRESTQNPTDDKVGTDDFGDILKKYE